METKVVGSRDSERDSSTQGKRSVSTLVLFFRESGC